MSPHLEQATVTRSGTGGEAFGIAETLPPSGLKSLRFLQMGQSKIGIDSRPHDFKETVINDTQPHVRSQVKLK